MVSSTDEIIKGSAKLGVPKGKKISTKTDKHFTIKHQTKLFKKQAIISVS